MRKIPQPSFKRFIVNKNAEGCVLAPSLSAPCAGRGFRLPFLDMHKMPGDIRLCCARSVAAVKARGTQAAGPKETFTSLCWKG